MLPKDISNIILQYTFSKCYDCKRIRNHTKLFFDYFIKGETICHDCGWECCDLCRYKFNRFDNRNINCYIQNVGLYCPTCFIKLKKCEQCFDINAVNESCNICQLTCCSECKDTWHEICNVCLFFFEQQEN